MSHIWSWKERWSPSEARVQRGGTVRLRQGEQGAAVVEFALVLPILMMFVFGIVEFGRGYNAASS